MCDWNGSLLDSEHVSLHVFANPDWDSGQARAISRNGNCMCERQPRRNSVGEARRVS